MAEEQCPYCGNDKFETETALQAPRSDAHIGRWRIGCGYTLFLVVALIGVVSLIARTLWLDGSLETPANWIALAAFAFAAFLLFGTVYLSGWYPMNRHTCQKCGLSWLTEIEVPQSGSPPIQQQSP